MPVTTISVLGDLKLVPRLENLCLVFSEDYLISWLCICSKSASFCNCYHDYFFLMTNIP